MNTSRIISLLHYHIPLTQNTKKKSPHQNSNTPPHIHLKNPSSPLSISPRYNQINSAHPIPPAFSLFTHLLSLSARTFAPVFVRPRMHRQRNVCVCLSTAKSASVCTLTSRAWSESEIRKASERTRACEILCSYLCAKLIRYPRCTRVDTHACA